MISAANISMEEVLDLEDESMVVLLLSGLRGRSVGTFLRDEDSMLGAGEMTPSASSWSWCENQQLSPAKMTICISALPQVR